MEEFSENTVKGYSIKGSNISRLVKITRTILLCLQNNEEVKRVCGLATSLKQETNAVTQAPKLLLHLGHGLERRKGKTRSKEVRHYKGIQHRSTPPLCRASIFHISFVLITSKRPCRVEDILKNTSEVHLPNTFHIQHGDSTNLREGHGTPTPRQPTESAATAWGCNLDSSAPLPVVLDHLSERGKPGLRPKVSISDLTAATHPFHPTKTTLASSAHFPNLGSFHCV